MTTFQKFLKIFLNLLTGILVILFVIMFLWGSYIITLSPTHCDDMIKVDCPILSVAYPVTIIMIFIYLFVIWKIVKNLFKIQSLRKHFILFFSTCGLYVIWWLVETLMIYLSYKI